MSDDDVIVCDFKPDFELNDGYKHRFDIIPAKCRGYRSHEWDENKLISYKLAQVRQSGAYSM